MKMMKLLAFVFAIIPMTGCHCLPANEHWHDTVDAIADSEAQFDECYCPLLDVSRWGRWDGPSCCRNCR